MKTMFLATLGIALLCLGVIVSSARALTLDFENKEQEKDWKFVTGKWGIENGVLKQTNQCCPAIRAFLSDAVWDPKWKDYTMEVKVRIDEGSTGWAGVTWRAESDLEYYVFYFGEGLNAEIWRHIPPIADSRVGINSHPPRGVTIKKGVWLNFKVIVEKDRFQIFFNDELQDDFKDPNLGEGRIGLWTWSSFSSFDDVKISGEGIPGTELVNPSGKLASTWGKIKSAYME